MYLKIFDMLSMEDFQLKYIVLQCCFWSYALIKTNKYMLKYVYLE